jgi:dolichol-phosphate mannosyltransferase
MSSPSLSVIIPALNERENLEVLIPRIQAVTRELGIEAEILVVNGPSRDGTAEAATALSARVVPQKERGYGGALVAGFAAASAEYVLTMDADLSHPPTFIGDLWNHRADADLIIASRYVPGGGATMGWSRVLMSRLLNVMFRLLLRLPVRDLSSGYRLYRRSCLEPLRLVSRDFDVLEEILVLGYRRQWLIKEMPFYYMPRQMGASHAKLIRFGWAYLKTLVRMYKLRVS